MDVSRIAASVVIVGFEGTTSIPASAKELLGRGVLGAILFKRNFEEAGQVAELNAQLKRQASRPFLTCVDQEGGRVARLRGEPFTAVPSMRVVAAGGEGHAASVGALLAREVRAAGFDVDFAPVLDVDTNPANPVIGDRSFGPDPRLVGRLGVALGRAMEAEGVASCGKHFPGHGDTAQDSHLTLPRLTHDLERLRHVELLPFAAWAKAKLSMVMTAHVVFETVEPGIPATFSRRVLKDLLRDELGFQGAVVTDDLEMSAIADRFPAGEAAVRTVEAGADVLLVCHRVDRQEEAIEALAREAEGSPAFRARLEEASARGAAVARRFAAPPAGPQALSLLRSVLHRELAARIAASDPAGADPTSA